jgi:alkylhydroperoxidase/carboxymuconolactone decarboxylase family protein YurZ
MAFKDQTREIGPWDAALEQVREWDPEWADDCAQMATNPWNSGALPRKTVELISLAINAACTNLNPDGTRRHIRAALDAGATPEEILMLLKMASVMSIHSCSLGAPILLEEAKAAGVKLTARAKAATPACDKMRAVGQWNEAWEPFFELDPVWTDQFMATGLQIYGSGLMTPKLIELLSIAFDAVVHPYVCAGYAASYQGRAEARRDNGRDHGGAEVVRRAGRPGVQYGRADSR